MHVVGYLLHNSLAFTQVPLYTTIRTFYTAPTIAVNYSNQLPYKWVANLIWFFPKFDFFQILTPIGFCAIFLWSFSFQITKRHSCNGCSIYMPSFNQFLPPCRCDRPSTFLLVIILLDSNQNWYRKGFNKPFMLPRFSLISTCICNLWLKMQVYKEKMKRNFACLYLVLACTICFKFSM